MDRPSPYRKVPAMARSVPRSTQLAERLAAFRLSDVPPEVVSRAKLILLDTLGAMLAASNQKYSPTRILADFARRLGGRHFLEAIILGIEVTCRVSYALNPVALYKRGFHPSAICGAFGAAASAGHLFRLSAAKFAIALGLAMQQASCLLAWASDRTENSRPFNPGLAARDGTTAAYLASPRFGGPPTPFEGKYDAFSAFSGERNPAPART
jgi:2-methylcitrate dehydratase PrpD